MSSAMAMSFYGASLHRLNDYCMPHMSWRGNMMDDIHGGTSSGVESRVIFYLI